MRHLLGVNLPTIGLCISGRCFLLPRNPEEDACDNYSSGRALRERNDAAPSTRASLIKKPCLFSTTCILAAQVIVLTTQLYCTSGIRRRSASALESDATTRWSKRYVAAACRSCSLHLNTLSAMKYRKGGRFPSIFNGDVSTADVVPSVMA